MEIKGFTYGWDSRRGMLGTERSAESIGAMSELGINWAALAFGVSQEKYCSTSFGADYRFTNTDREIERAVAQMKERGLKVCLKPVVNCRDGFWRAHITFPDKEPFGETDIFGRPKGCWNRWFSCYTAFICHYAEIAEYTGCEMLCIGCEMIGTEHKEEHWRDLIAKVRKIYSGALVYNANHGKEDNVKWFDALDYIGTSAYYPVAKNGEVTAEEMLRSWEEPKRRLAALSERFGKKIIFMEIGCRSAKGCAAMPWDFMHHELPRDEDEQSNFYESAFRAMWDEPYFEGFFWWDWATFLPDKERIGTDRGFSIYGKKAMETVKGWYGKL